MVVELCTGSTTARVPLRTIDRRERLNQADPLTICEEYTF